MINENAKAKELIASGKGKLPVTAGGKSAEEILKADPTTVTPEDIVRVTT